MLRIQSGKITLPGYDTGFIGGCSFCDDNNVYFYGDINKHPDGELIKRFIINHGKQIVCLHSDSLIDVGGFVVFD